MSNFIRRQQNDWSDLSDDLIDSDESTETTCAFQIGNMVAKAKTLKASSAIKQQPNTSHFRIRNEDINEPAENRDFAQNADNYNFTLPHLPAFRTPTIPKARDCLNPSDSDVSVLVVRKPQTMCKTIKSSAMATRRDYTTRETVQKIGEVPPLDIIERSNNSSLSSKNRESFNTSDLLRREVHRRQMAGPTINRISSEKVSYSDLSKLINAVKTNTISPRKKQILLEALDTSSKNSVSGSDVSRRSLQSKKRQLSSSVRNGYSPSSSETSCGDDYNYSSPYRRKQYKQRNTKKSFNMYYNRGTKWKDNNYDSLSTHSIPISNRNDNSHLVYRHTMQPVQTAKYDLARDASVLNTSKLPRYQEIQKDYARGYSMMSDYSNLSMQPSLIKRKLYSQSELFSKNPEVNNSESPMRQATIHNVYKVGDDSKPRKRKLSTLSRPSIAHRNMTFSKHNLSLNVNPGSITPLLRKLASRERSSDPVLIDNNVKRDLYTDFIPSDNSQDKVPLNHFTSETSHNHLSKSRKLFTSGTDSENEDEKLRKERLQKVQMDLKSRKCYVAIERIPIRVLESILPQSKKEIAKNPLNSNKNEIMFKVPKNPIRGKKNVVSTEVNNSVDFRPKIDYPREANKKQRITTKKLSVNEISEKSKRNSPKSEVKLKNTNKQNTSFFSESDSHSDDTEKIVSEEEMSNAIVEINKSKFLSPVKPIRNDLKKPSSPEILVTMSSDLKTKKSHGKVEDNTQVPCVKEIDTVSGNTCKETGTSEANALTMNSENVKPITEVSLKCLDAPPAKRKYVKKDKTVKLTEVRRSSRIRVPPLKYWENESAIYKQGRLYSWQQNYSNSAQSYPLNASDANEQLHTTSSFTVNSNEENNLPKSATCSQNDVQTEKPKEPKRSEQVTEVKEKKKRGRKKKLKEDVEVTKKSTNKTKQSISSQGTVIENMYEKLDKFKKVYALRNKTSNKATRKQRSTFWDDNSFEKSISEEDEVDPKTCIVEIEEERSKHIEKKTVVDKLNNTSKQKRKSRSEITNKKNNVLNNISNTALNKNENLNKEKVNLSIHSDINSRSRKANQVRSIKNKDKNKNATSPVQEQSEMFVNQTQKQYNASVNVVTVNSDDDETWSVSFCSTTASKKSKSKFLHFF